ncbi:hypothetical protein SLS56_010532 [Neofusicoccum ribis]|uniref:Uncharacterized protein n=1 Tax=Neofusicoccum ribis TaxID=45134 RepID=A0ABR3SE69_9PEZI
MATSSSPSGHVFGFLDLPGEIRNNIYDHAVKDVCKGLETTLQLFGYETEPEDVVKLVMSLTDIRACHFHRPWSSFEVSDPRCLKSALRLYRLGWVSRAVRREFFSMLFAGLHFRVCRCGLQDLAHGRREAGGSKHHPPLSILRGNVRALLVETHSEDRYGPRVAWLLGKALPALQFKGQVATVGTSREIRIFSDAMKLVTAAFLAGKEYKSVKDALKRLYFEIDWLESRFFLLNDTIPDNLPTRTSFTRDSLPNINNASSDKNSTSTDNSTSLMRRGALKLAESPPPSPARHFKPASASPATMQSATSPPSPTASQASHSRDVSRFMGLAGELRNRIYECVLEDLTTTPDNPIGINAYKVNPRTSARRKNLASCRLGDVSRTVRKEFAPMLRAALQHFSICTCRAADDTDGVSDDLSRDLARGLLEPLHGRVQHLTLDKHGGEIYTGMQEMLHLGSALMFLRFKGQFKVVATETYAESIQRALSIYEIMSEGVALVESGRAFVLVQQTLIYYFTMQQAAVPFPVDYTIVEKTFLLDFSFW